jgi:pimeloyl-ACP methyl ester carboxylesterase
LAVVQEAAHGKPVILIGSSMGGYLAALFAQTHPEVTRAVLLAPAFGFYSLWAQELGPARMAEWRKNGAFPVFHYGEGRKLGLGYELMEDAQRYDPFPAFPQPCMIFHGTQDSVVPVSLSQKYASGTNNVSLKLLNSGHELTDVLDEIWNDAKPFLLDGMAGR